MSDDIREYIGKIINDDCRNTLAALPKNSVDLILTSPPYDDLRTYKHEITWNFEIFQKIAAQMFEVLTAGGVLVWIVADKTHNGNKSLTSFRQALHFQTIGFSVYDIIIYEKTGTAPPHKNRFFSAYEFMFVLSKGKPKTINLLRDKKTNGLEQIRLAR